MSDDDGAQADAPLVLGVDLEVRAVDNASDDDLEDEEGDGTEARRGPRVPAAVDPYALKRQLRQWFSRALDEQAEALAADLVAPQRRAYYCYYPYAALEAGLRQLTPHAARPLDAWPVNDLLAATRVVSSRALPAALREPYDAAVFRVAQEWNEYQRVLEVATAREWRRDHAAQVDLWPRTLCVGQVNHPHECARFRLYRLLHPHATPIGLAGERFTILGVGPPPRPPPDTQEGRARAGAQLRTQPAELELRLAWAFDCYKKLLGEERERLQAERAQRWHLPDHRALPPLADSVVSGMSDAEAVWAAAVETVRQRLDEDPRHEDVTLQALGREGQWASTALLLWPTGDGARPQVTKDHARLVSECVEALIQAAQQEQALGFLRQLHRDVLAFRRLATTPQERGGFEAPLATLKLWRTRVATRAHQAVQKRSLKVPAVQDWAESRWELVCGLRLAQRLWTQRGRDPAVVRAEVKAELLRAFAAYREAVASRVSTRVARDPALTRPPEWHTPVLEALERLPAVPHVGALGPAPPKWPLPDSLLRGGVVSPQLHAEWQTLLRATVGVADEWKGMTERLLTLVRSALDYDALQERAEPFPYPEYAEALWRLLVRAHARAYYRPEEYA